ncbi:MAG: 2-oxoglutarate and iron-dependent oxygenase domain-containing protein [Acidobacteriota bacterium]
MTRPTARHQTAIEPDFQEIPVIDIGALVADDPSPEALRETVERIGAACRHVGFFYIDNHGVSEADRDEMFAEMMKFFDLPLDEKMKLHIGASSQFRGYVPLCGEVTEGKKDWHECIDLQPKALEGGAPGTLDPVARTGHPLDDPGQWPEALPSFRRVMMRSWTQLYDLAGKVARGMALSLGLEPDYFEPYAGPALCALRLAHYPPFEGEASDEIDAGMGAHCDLGFLAILQQDDVGGLEVRNARDEWIAVPRIPGTFLVNIGEMMQRWTNDRYRATLHRVRLPRGTSRYALPFFFEPRYDTLVTPLEVCCDEGEKPHYAPFRFGDYLTERFSKAYD